MIDDSMNVVTEAWARRNLRARVGVTETANLLGFAEHDIQTLMRVGLLKPLARRRRTAQVVCVGGCDSIGDGCQMVECRDQGSFEVLEGQKSASVCAGRLGSGGAAQDRLMSSRAFGGGT